MNIKPNRRAGLVWLLCIAIAGVIVVGGVLVYVLIKCCAHIPNLGASGCTNTNDTVSLRLVGVPREGAGAYRLALTHWDGGTNFTLQLLMPENLLNSKPRTYTIHGTVDLVTSNAATMRVYDEQGQFVSTNWTPAVIP